MSNLVTSKISDYVEALYGLLPRSRMWGRLFQEPGWLFWEVAQYTPDLDSDYIGGQPIENKYSTILGRFLSIFGIALYRLDDKIYALREEAIPQKSTELLEEWEAIYNITDPASTIEQRREELDFLITNRSKPRSFAVIKEVAEFYGMDITIENLDIGTAVGMCGVGVCGLATCANPVWGGIVKITINTIGAYTFEEAKELLTPSIHAGARIEWLNLDTTDVTMRYESGDSTILMRYNGTDEDIIME